MIPDGNVVVTDPGLLPCKKIIHAVGPRWGKGGFEKPLLLKKTVFNSLELAGALGFKSIGMSAISV